LKTEYTLNDFSGAFCWVRLRNDTFLVDPRFEQEFIENVVEWRARYQKPLEDFQPPQV